MRKKILFVLILFALSISVSFTGLKLNTEAEREIENAIPHSSAVSIPIHIDGNQEWLNFKNAGNCTGQGTFNDPYLIRDLNINGEHSIYCISVENSNVYFKIENVSVYNASYGIKLFNVSNGHLYNNTANHNRNIGMRIESSNNLVFSGNIVNNNPNGIYLLDIVNSTVSGNTISNNDIYGMIFSGNNNTFSGNFFNGNSLSVGEISYLLAPNIIDSTNLVNGKPLYYYENMIDLEPSDFLNAGQVILINSNNSVISGLNISNTEIAICIVYGNHNTVSGNIINGNSYGLFLIDSNDNKITNNIINENYIGISIKGRSSSSMNSIYLNCFNNTINALDDSILNSWDNGVNGNYWSDYNSEDNPYDIKNPQGGVVNYDNFPLSECKIDDQGYGIPGYDPFFLIGIICLTAVLLLHRLKKIFNNQ